MHNDIQNLESVGAKQPNPYPLIGYTPQSERASEILD